jgi:hypothetical protein
MPKRTLAEVTKSAILIEKKLHVKEKSMENIVHIILIMTNLKIVMMKMNITKRRLK